MRPRSKLILAFNEPSLFPLATTPLQRAGLSSRRRIGYFLGTMVTLRLSPSPTLCVLTSGWLRRAMWTNRRS